MRPLLASLLTVPVVLVAQDKAPEPFHQRYKAEAPGMEKLLKERNAAEALARVEALIPAQKPVFDRSTPLAAQASTADFSSFMAAHSLAGKAALQAGHWEKSLDHFKQAESIAKENARETEAAFTPAIEGWTKAVEEGKKQLQEGAERRAELKGKAQLDEREQAELDNFKVYEQNVRMGPIQVAKLRAGIEALKGDAEGFAKIIEGVGKSLDEERGNLEKFKGDKAKYVAAVFNPGNMALRQNVNEKLDFLARLTVLDPKNAKVTREIDKLMGRPVAPEPKPTKGGKKKGK